MAQFHHQVEEIFRLVAFERHHEFLVVKAERVRGVQPHGRVIVPDFDVLVHHPLPGLLGQPVPGACLDEGIDEKVSEFHRMQFQPRAFLAFVPVVVHVNGFARHGEVRVRRGQVIPEAGREQRGGHLLKLQQVVTDAPKEKIAVASNAHQ